MLECSSIANSKQLNDTFLTPPLLIGTGGVYQAKKKNEITKLIVRCRTRPQQKKSNITSLLLLEMGFLSFLLIEPDYGFERNIAVKGM